MAWFRYYLSRILKLLRLFELLRLPFRIMATCCSSDRSNEATGVNSYKILLMMNFLSDSCYFSYWRRLKYKSWCTTLFSLFVLYTFHFHPLPNWNSCILILLVQKLVWRNVKFFIDLYLIYFLAGWINSRRMIF